MQGRTWLTRVGPYRVEHMPMPSPEQPADAGAPRKVVLHTTEGSLESALSVFRVHFSPTFTVGLDRRGRVRVIQHIAIGQMAAALENHRGGVETNREVWAQIELVGRSQHEPWQPAAGVMVALAHLALALKRHGVPLRHPNVARGFRLWLRAAGWVGHIDVPENEHWDPGAFKYPHLFALARDLEDGSTHKARRKPRRVHRPRTYVLRWRANGIPYTELSCPCPKETK